MRLETRTAVEMLDAPRRARSLRDPLLAVVRLHTALAAQMGGVDFVRLNTRELLSHTKMHSVGWQLLSVFSPGSAATHPHLNRFCVWCADLSAGQGGCEPFARGGPRLSHDGRAAAAAPVAAAQRRARRAAPALRFAAARVPPAHRRAARRHLRHHRARALSAAERPLGHPVHQAKGTAQLHRDGDARKRLPCLRPGQQGERTHVESMTTTPAPSRTPGSVDDQSASLLPCNRFMRPFHFS
eukprot:6101829-Pleurochrysis_carterae.AAC.2